MVLIYQVLTRQCLKKVFLTSNDFVPNDSSLLNHTGGFFLYFTVLSKKLANTKWALTLDPPIWVMDPPLCVYIYDAKFA